MDYSKLSDSQLVALHTGDYSKLSDDDLSALHQATAPAPKPTPPSTLEAGLRGAAQGATLGFADELTGGAEALKDKLTGSDKAFGDLYKQHRDESRANYQAAQQAHPVAYGAGQVGGGLAGAVAAPVGAGLKGAAAVGGLMGLGNSNADLTQGDYGGALKDTAIGGVAGAASGLVGRAIANKFAPAAESVVKQAPDVGGFKQADQGLWLPSSMNVPAAAPAAPTSGAGFQLGGAIKSLAMGHPVAAATKAITQNIGLDKIGSALQMSPQSFGKYAPILQQAAARGGSALATTHFILGQNDEGYRKQIEGLPDKQ